MTIGTWIVLTVIYMCGYWANYFLFRSIITEEMNARWTLQKRLLTLVCSIISWVGIVCYGIVYAFGVKGKINLSKEVKW